MSDWADQKLWCRYVELESSGLLVTGECKEGCMSVRAWARPKRTLGKGWAGVQRVDLREWKIYGNFGGLPSYWSEYERPSRFSERLILYQRGLRRGSRISFTRFVYYEIGPKIQNNRTIQLHRVASFKGLEGKRFVVEKSCVVKLCKS